MRPPPCRRPCRFAPCSRASAPAASPCETSPSAGTFLCNHVFFHLVEHAWRDEPSLLAGFVHLPYIEPHLAAHPGSPYLPLEVLVRGIVEAIGVLDT